MKSNHSSTEDPRGTAAAQASASGATPGNDRAGEADAIEFRFDETLARFGGDRELLAEMVEYFFTDSPATVDAMRRGIEINDLALSAREAHRLKGTLAYFGVPPVLAIVLRIEHAGNAGDHDAAADDVERLGAMLALMRRVLAPYRRPGIA